MNDYQIAGAILLSSLIITVISIIAAMIYEYLR